MTISVRKVAKDRRRVQQRKKIESGWSGTANFALHRAAGRGLRIEVTCAADPDAVAVTGSRHPLVYFAGFAASCNRQQIVDGRSLPVKRVRSQTSRSYRSQLGKAGNLRRRIQHGQVVRTLE